MTQKNKHIHRKFTLRVPNGFFRVKIFKTFEAMQLYGYEQARLMGLCRRNAFYASCALWKKGRWLGEIIFCKQWIGGGIVAHEMTHAALHALRPTSERCPAHIITSGDVEEKLANGVESLVKQFWKKWYAR